MALNIKFVANTSAIRKAFGEMTKQQRAAWRLRQQQLRIEENAQRKERKRLDETHKLKDIRVRKETTTLQKQAQLQEKQQKSELTHHNKMLRAQDDGQRKTIDNMRKTDREVQRLTGGRLGRALGVVGRGAGLLAGGAIGVAIGAGFQDYANFKQYRESLKPLLGLGGFGGGTPSATRRFLPKKALKKGPPYGYSAMESAGLGGQFGRATGVIDSLLMRQSGRAMPMDPGALVKLFGGMVSTGGFGFSGTATRGVGDPIFGGYKEKTDRIKDETGRKAYERLISGAFASGLKQARFPEYFEGVQQILRGQIGQLAGKADWMGLSRLLASVMRFGGRKDILGLKEPGRAADLIGQIQQAMQQPGMGEEGQALHLRAMGYGRPGGVDLYTATKRLEQGLTGEGEGQKNFGRMMREFERSTMAGKDRTWAMSKVWKITLEQAEAIDQYWREGGRDVEDALAIMDQPTSIEKRADKAMGRDVAGTNLRQTAKLMNASIRAGEKVAEDIEKLQNSLREMANKLIKILPTLVNALTSVVDAINRAIEFFDPTNDDSAAKRTRGREPVKKTIKELQQEYFSAKTPKARARIAKKIHDVARAQEEAEWEHEEGEYVKNPITGELEVGNRGSQSTFFGVQAHTPALYEAYLKGRGLKPSQATPAIRKRFQTRMWELSRESAGAMYRGVGTGRRGGHIKHFNPSKGARKMEDMGFEDSGFTMTPVEISSGETDSVVGGVRIGAARASANQEAGLGSEGGTGRRWGQPIFEVINKLFLPPGHGGEQVGIDSWGNPIPVETAYGE